MFSKSFSIFGSSEIFGISPIVFWAGGGGHIKCLKISRMNTDAMNKVGRSNAPHNDT